MNHAHPATTAEEFGYTLLGIISALTVGILFAACAYALHTWPAQTLLLSAPALAACFVLRHPLASITLLAGPSN